MKKEPIGSFFMLVFKGTNSFIVLVLFVKDELAFPMACFEGTTSFINPMLCFFYG